MGMSGDEVVTRHRRAVDSCSGKVKYDRLKCVVDAMQREFATSS